MKTLEKPETILQMRPNGVTETLITLQNVVKTWYQRKIMNSFNMQRFNAAGQVFEVDPVCEMKVDPQNPPFKILYKDKTYYFCSKACKHLFERVPEKYIKTDTA